MLKSTSFSVFVLAFVALLAGQGQAKPKPGLLDFLKGDECEEIDDNSCAIVYDDEDCGEGNFLKLRFVFSELVVRSHEQLIFSLNLLFLCYVSKAREFKEFTI